VYASASVGVSVREAELHLCRWGSMIEGQTETSTASAIAVFDLEGTLCHGGDLLWREMIKRQLEYSAARRLISRLGLDHKNGARVRVIRDLAPLLKGLKDEDINELAGRISSKMVAQLRPDVGAMLQAHKQHDRHVVLMSTMFQPFLEVIGQRLNVDITIGTELEKRGPCYSGQASGPICFNEKRAWLLKKRLRETGLKVDMSVSYAYGDTIWDKPVLQMVGSELRAYALEQGWTVVD
jgi:HAD superfamily phosphoserine phosphatase-like hydrolase